MACAIQIRCDQIEPRRECIGGTDGEASFPTLRNPDGQWRSLRIVYVNRCASDPGPSCVLHTTQPGVCGRTPFRLQPVNPVVLTHRSVTTNGPAAIGGSQTEIAIVLAVELAARYRRIDIHVPAIDVDSEAIEPDRANIALVPNAGLGVVSEARTIKCNVRRCKCRTTRRSDDARCQGRCCGGQAIDVGPLVQRPIVRCIREGEVEARELR